MSIEAMKQALEALVQNNQDWKALADSGDAGWWEAEETNLYKQTAQAITSLCQAIAEAEKQEPVAWYDSESGWTDFHSFKPARKPSSPSAKWLPLYIHPQPKREWVGLTVMEAVELDIATNHPREFAAAIEAKLKDKNGF